MLISNRALRPLPLGRGLGLRPLIIGLDHYLAPLRGFNACSRPSLCGCVRATMRSCAAFMPAAGLLASSRRGWLPVTPAAGYAHLPAPGGLGSWKWIQGFCLVVQAAHASAEGHHPCLRQAFTRVCRQFMRARALVSPGLRP